MYQKCPQRSRALFCCTAFDVDAFFVALENRLMTDFESEQQKLLITHDSNKAFSLTLVLDLLLRLLREKTFIYVYFNNQT